MNVQYVFELTVAGVHCRIQLCKELNSVLGCKRALQCFNTRKFNVEDAVLDRVIQSGSELDELLDLHSYGKSSEKLNTGKLTGLPLKM